MSRKKDFTMSVSNEYRLDLSKAGATSVLCYYSNYSDAVQLSLDGQFEAGSTKVSVEFNKEVLAEVIKDLQSVHDELVESDAEYAEKLAVSG